MNLSAVGVLDRIVNQDTEGFVEQALICGETKRGIGNIKIQKHFHLPGFRNVNPVAAVNVPHERIHRAKPQGNIHGIGFNF